MKIRSLIILTDSVVLTLRKFADDDVETIGCDQLQRGNSSFKLTGEQINRQMTSGGVDRCFNNTLYRLFWEEIHHRLKSSKINPLGRGVVDLPVTLWHIFGLTLNIKKYYYPVD